MQIHFNTDPADLLIELRYRAIANGSSPQIIDCLDRAEAELIELRAENAEQCKGKSAAENDRDDLYDELQDLVNAVRDSSLTWERDVRLKATYQRAVAALERHDS